MKVTIEQLDGEIPSLKITAETSAEEAILGQIFNDSTTYGVDTREVSGERTLSITLAEGA